LLLTRASESEAKLAFAGLSDLLEGVGEEAQADLPPPQRRALRVALLQDEAEGPPPEHRAVAAGLLGVLRHLGATGAVLIGIDDLQWLDPSTGRALEFAFRRLKQEPVGLLASVRVAAPGAPAPFALDRALDPEWLARLAVGPLSLGATGHILHAQLGPQVSRLTLRRIHQASGGNPFFALELARALVRAGVEPDPEEPLPVPEDLRALVRGRLGALPPKTREALLVAAALSGPTVEVVARAIRSTRALEAGVAADVVGIAGGRISFTHPLLASVRYGEASDQERRRVHLRLAEVLDDPEERARHLALATDHPDDTVAALLEEAARLARARGATDAAAELMGAACRLTPEGRREDRVRRGKDVAWYRWDLGDTDRGIAELQGLVSMMPPGPARADVLVRLAVIIGQYAGTPSDAFPLASQALEEAGDDWWVAVGALTWMSIYAERAERSLSLAEEGASLLREHEGELPDVSTAAGGPFDWKIVAMNALANARNLAGLGSQVPLLEEAVAIENARGISLASGARSSLAFHLVEVDELDRARAMAEELYRMAEEEGDETAQPVFLLLEAVAACWTGDLDRASVAAREARDRFVQFRAGMVLATTLALLAYIDALRGEVDRARAEAQEAIAGGQREAGLWALGFVELSLGDHGKAESYCASAEVLGEARGARTQGQLGNWVFWADHIEALIALGKLDRAGTLLERMDERGRASGRAWTIATAARCRGLLSAARGDVGGALHALDQALVEHQRLPMPFELGRTHLVRGMVERRAKHKRAAKESLQQAVMIFERVGTPLWAAKSRGELGRVGLRPAAPLSLTPTEERVAELAGQGLTNREVAEKLFMSPRTVESNLIRTYRKLGISSRAELGAAMALRTTGPLPR
jgi:DNA-binding CsgD family transcriptional regulator